MRASRWFPVEQRLIRQQPDELTLFASEKKCFIGLGVAPQEVPPGCYWSNGKLDRYVGEGVEKFVLREAFRGEIPDYMIDRPKIRIPEGIGIHDQIFNALSDVTPNGDIVLPDINIDGPQVRNALAMFLECGYDPPIERYKKIGTDYFQGGYFNFNDAS